MSESRENPKRTRAEMSSAQMEILFFFPFPMFLSSRTPIYVVIFFRDCIALFHSLYQDLLRPLFENLMGNAYLSFYNLAKSRLHSFLSISHEYNCSLYCLPSDFRLMVQPYYVLFCTTNFLTTFFCVCGLSLDPTCE